MKMSPWLRPPTSILSNASRTVVVWVGLAVLTVAMPWTAATQAAASSGQSRHINAERLQGTLEKLSEFGRNPEGGVTRLGFSQTEMDARTYVIGLIYRFGPKAGSRHPISITSLRKANRGPMSSSRNFGGAQFR